MGTSYRVLFLLSTSALVALVSVTQGCGMGMSALSAGSTAPAIEASGWTNDGPPADLEGSVVVLEMFATW